jgi:hypothetical protein
VNLTQEPATAPSAPSARRSLRPWRWSLTTLLLVMGVVAVWTRVGQLSMRNGQLRRDLETMHLLAYELVVEDAEQYAVIRQPAEWQGENIWRVYLPPEHQHTLWLASRDIGGVDFPAPVASASLLPGEHVIEFRREKGDSDSWRLEILVDGETAIAIDEAGDWETSFSLSSKGWSSRTMQFPTSAPLELERLRFHTVDAQSGRSGPSEQSNGVLLWITAEDD